MIRNLGEKDDKGEETTHGKQRKKMQQLCLLEAQKMHDDRRNQKR